MKTMQSNFTNIGEALQVHNAQIEHTSLKISGLNENLETALATSKSLRDRLGDGSLHSALRIVTPLAIMLFGSLILSSTLAHNMAFYLVGEKQHLGDKPRLMNIGVVLGEVIVWLLSCDWPMYLAWLLPKYPMPLALIHLARERLVSSISTTPVEELLLATAT